LKTKKDTETQFLVENCLWNKPWNHRLGEVGKDLWRSSGPTPWWSRITYSWSPGPQNNRITEWVGLEGTL